MKTRASFLAWCVFALAVWNTHGFSPITLRTSSGLLSNVKGKDILDFLATPSNWPKIVLSSSDVRGLASLNVDQPLRPGNRVAEIFGLPPVLPLSVEWVCRSNTYPVLDVMSSGGVTGIASNCRMLFTVREVLATSTTATTTTQSSEAAGVLVELEMSYTPLSLLAVLAVPALVIDNTLALKGLLPRAIKAQSNSQSNDRAALIKPIDEFRALMGVLLLHDLTLTLSPSYP